MADRNNRELRRLMWEIGQIRLEMAPPGAESRLVLYPKSLMPNWQELKPSIVFECEDMQATYESLEKRGVEFMEEPRPMAWGTYARFRDPDGNVFLLRGPQSRLLESGTDRS